MQVHGSCVAREGAGILLTGAPGAGKSDLALRLLSRGFELVADDRVEIADGLARPPPSLAGLLEVRGVGIVRLPHAGSARLVLVVELTEDEDRLPAPARDPVLQIALIRLNAASPSTPDRVAMALDCALGRVGQLAGAFEP